MFLVHYHQNCKGHLKHKISKTFINVRIPYNYVLSSLVWLFKSVLVFLVFFSPCFSNWLFLFVYFYITWFELIFYIYGYSPPPPPPNCGSGWSGNLRRFYYIVQYELYTKQTLLSQSECFLFFNVITTLLWTTVAYYYF